MDQPLTRLRIKLYEIYADPEPRFGIPELKAFMKEVADSMIDTSYLMPEIDSAMNAYEKGEPLHEDINLKTPETQLVWAAALIAIHKGLENELSVVNGRWHGMPYIHNLEDHPAWEAVVGSPEASAEMMSYARHVHEGLHRDDTRFSWCEPDEWFAYDPENNSVNVNMLLSLLNGFEHTRSILFHEIGHSQLTTKYMPEMMDIRRRMEPIVEKTKNKEKISPFEYINLRVLNAEWTLRNKLFEASENAVVNRYTANMGDTLAQDYAYSLNAYLVNIAGYGQLHLDRQEEQELRYAIAELWDLVEGTEYQDKLEELATRKNTAANRNATLLFINMNKDKFLEEFMADVETSPLKRLLERADKADIKEQFHENLGDILRDRKSLTNEQISGIEIDADSDEEVQAAYQRFLHILSAVNMVFYQNNALFENTREGWLSVGVDPDEVKITSPSFQHSQEFLDTHSDQDFPSADLAYLIELCGGEDGIEHLQTSARDRWLGRDFFKKRSDDMSDRRNEIAERIWDLYLKQDADILLQQVRTKAEDKLEKVWRGTTASSDTSSSASVEDTEEKRLLYPQGGDHPHPVDKNDRFNPSKVGTSTKGNKIIVNFKGAIGRDGKPLWKSDEQTPTAQPKQMGMQPK